MGSESGHHINVQTVGICTYFTSGVPGLPEGQHRVVLVNASDPSRFPQSFRDQGVGAHVATMQILESDVVGDLPEARHWLPMHRADGYVVWKLSGVTVTIENAVPTSAGTPLTCVPHLRLYSAEDHLPPPGEAAMGSDRELTACVFDYPPSALEGRTLPPGGAAVGVLTILTEGTPRISVRPFGSTTEMVSFQLGDGPGITLANIPADASTDKDADFLLHFLTLNAVPAGATFPLEPFVCRPLDRRNLPVHLGIEELTVPGCSNSNYP